MSAILDFCGIIGKLGASVFCFIACIAFQKPCFSFFHELYLRLFANQSMVTMWHSSHQLTYTHLHQGALRYVLDYYFPYLCVCCVNVTNVISMGCHIPARSEERDVHSAQGVGGM